MSALFPQLFSPFEIRGKRFKNRLFLAPHGTGYAEGGGVGERGLAYYKARVENGIALLTSEATKVVPTPGQQYAQLSAGSDDCVPHFRQLAELCHAHDCRYFGQLYHEGRARAHLSEGSRDVAIAPSALPDERFHIVPQAMSVATIESLVDCFGAAAGRLARAGADGAEIIGRHGLSARPVHPAQEPTIALIATGARLKIAVAFCAKRLSRCASSQAMIWSSAFASCLTTPTRTATLRMMPSRSAK